MRIDTALLTALAEELHEYKDDDQAFWDTIDGETDVMDLVGSILGKIIESDASADTLNLVAKQYTERASVMKNRSDALRRSLLVVLQSTGQTKIPHMIATVSLREGTEAVVITDEKEIPTQLCKVLVTPDKAEIKKQLKAGVTIDGAELVKGPQTVSIRMK